ncbi:hypothetical protein Q5424_19500 [Conexibacter sp. JD483]|uniref:hypothetical protein n=1 Tax=unclassified Conexibacter TaxID=2627773 RepID=UPI0027194263|nr:MULTISPECIES: hypothetical protein [unclassified Conexibacter]MDO8185902.1 hypothetical protein [Conexibacter sp. CPCC 205706]MDO8199393.1 hypothetical protein [Conexibacter sp. CPCC 205762]MDR9371293.1 hypothetical protein [Conexibacter sp. JD483]
MAVALLLLLVAQLALPRLAEDEVRRRLGGDEVTHVEVGALPAIELLWQHADRVSARVRSFDADGASIADDLAQTRKVDTLDVWIERVQATPEVELHDVRVEKRDGRLSGSATVDPDQVAAALPAGIEGRLLPSDDGAVRVAARIGGANVTLQVAARDGRVVARPEGLLGLISSYTLFGDPRIDVERIAAYPQPDGRVELRASARVVS